MEKKKKKLTLFVKVSSLVSEQTFREMFPNYTLPYGWKRYSMGGMEVIKIEKNFQRLDKYFGKSVEWEKKVNRQHTIATILNYAKGVFIKETREVLLPLNLIIIVQLLEGVFNPLQYPLCHYFVFYFYHCSCFK